MIAAGRDLLSIAEQGPDSRIDSLKKKINDEAYLYEAIQRIALVLSNEITGIKKGTGNERKRR